MSLYEIMSMFHSVASQIKGKVDITEEDWEQFQDILHDLSLSDPSVRLH